MRVAFGGILVRKIVCRIGDEYGGGVGSVGCCGEGGGWLGKGVLKEQALLCGSVGMGLGFW